MLERTIVFSAMNFPGHGLLARAIVNDVGPNPHDIDGRQMAISDYVVSLVSNTFSWQETHVSKSRLDKSWNTLITTGPIIHATGQGVKLPRVEGWPTTLAPMIVNRVQLERANEVMLGMSVASFEPSYSVPELL